MLSDQGPLTPSTRAAVPASAQRKARRPKSSRFFSVLSGNRPAEPVPTGFIHNGGAWRRLSQAAVRQLPSPAPFDNALRQRASPAPFADAFPSESAMSHVVILYTPTVEPAANVSRLCRALADTLLAQRDEQNAAVFPPGGVRVLAYAASHHAVCDDGSAGRAAGGTGAYDFVHVDLHMSAGRTDAVTKRAGDLLLEAATRELAPLFEHRHLGLAVHVYVGNEVFDGNRGTLHPLFRSVT